MPAEALQIYDAEQAPDATTGAAPVPSPRLIRLQDLFNLLLVSKSTGHRLLAAGKIGPSPIHLTPACVRFDAEEVAVWLSTRKQDGNLHDAKTWPAVWAAAKKRR